MKVALDISPLKNENKNRGIGKYTFFVKKELEKINELELLPFSKNENIPLSDLVHYPYFDPFYLTLPLVKKYPTVITIHDMIPFVFSKQFPKGIKGEIKWQIQKISLSSVKAIITDSYSSKKDIMKYTKVEENKIHVVYLGPTLNPINPDLRKWNEIKIKHHLPDKFFLYVGDINYNKNLENLYKAIKYVKEKINLVLVGHSFLNSNLKEKKELDDLSHKLIIDEQLIKVGFLEDEKLSLLYSKACAYIHPSLYEGFGLPVLDALNLGCPVITSNRGSLKEVVGDATILINPESVESITEGIEKILNLNVSEYNNMVEKGKTQAAKFSWQSTAQKTIRVYKNVIKGF